MAEMRGCLLTELSLQVFLGEGMNPSSWAVGIRELDMEYLGYYEVGPAKPPLVTWRIQAQLGRKCHKRTVIHHLLQI